jgi:hypothetical protein
MRVLEYSMESLSFALNNSIRFLEKDVIKTLLYYQINFNINMESRYGQ